LRNIVCSFVLVGMFEKLVRLNYGGCWLKNIGTSPYWNFHLVPQLRLAEGINVPVLPNLQELLPTVLKMAGHSKWHNIKRRHILFL